MILATDLTYKNHMRDVNEIIETTDGWMSNVGSLVTAFNSPLYLQLVDAIKRPFPAIFLHNMETLNRLKREDQLRKSTNIAGVTTGIGHMHTCKRYLQTRYGDEISLIVIPLSSIEQRVKIWKRPPTPGHWSMIVGGIPVSRIAFVGGGHSPEGEFDAALIENPFADFQKQYMKTDPRAMARTSDMLNGLWALRHYSIPTVYQIHHKTYSIDEVTKRNERVHSRKNCVAVKTACESEEK